MAAAWWAYRVRRRWAGPFAGCALLLTASCALASAPDGPIAGAVSTVGGVLASGAPLRVLQLNLCNSGVARCYTGRSVAEAAAVIRAEAPDAVTLNEVCADDVAVLEKAVGDLGGTTESAFQGVGDRRTGAPVHCRTGRLYGIGVVVRRQAGPGYVANSGVYPMQPTRGPEQRAWLCLGPGAGAAGTVVCTTHLSSGNPEVARAQCAYLLRTAVPMVRARSGAAPLVVGGDLNLQSGGSPDVASCVPADDRRIDDGAVQYVVATSEFTIRARRTIGLTATDHPGLLVTLTPAGG